jgi:hypothetical protein
MVKGIVSTMEANQFCDDLDRTMRGRSQLRQAICAIRMLAVLCAFVTAVALAETVWIYIHAGMCG